MYMLLEADAAFIFILSVSISYIPLITGNYLPFSDRHQQASGTVADVLPSDEKSTFSLGGGGCCWIFTYKKIQISVPL